MAGVPQRVSPMPVVLIIRKFFNESLVILIHYFVNQVATNSMATYFKISIHILNNV
jgi:hypothetical protein